MADYFLIKNYSSAGEIGISRSCFVAIANEAIKRVSGVSIASKGKKSKNVFNMRKPIQVHFKSNGQVELNLLIDINKENDVAKVCSSLQEEISSSLMEFTESIPFKINIKVAALL